MPPRGYRRGSGVRDQAAAGPGHGRPAAGLPVAWAAAAGAHGQEFEFRRMCGIAGVGYVPAVPESQQARADRGIRRIDQVIGTAPEEAWSRSPPGTAPKNERRLDRY